MTDKLYPDPTLKGDFSTVAKRKTYHRRRRGRMGDNAGHDDGNMIWLVTFTDIMGLMLTFFVLMFSMTEPKIKVFNDLTAALQNEFNTYDGRAMNAGPEDSIDIKRIDYDRALDLRYLQALMAATLERSDVLKSEVALIPQGDHLIISIPQALLFDAGDTTVKTASTQAIFTLGGTFSRMKNALVLVGHSVPQSGQQAGESQWTLSLTRAAAVAGALQKVGYTDPVVIRGEADGRYSDLDGIVDEKTRQDLSRRVDIDIMNHDGRRKKAQADSVLP